MKTNSLENHLGLVRSIVSKFDTSHIMDSDLFGIGCLALVEAQKSYKPEKGSFSTWATKLIKQSIFDSFRKSKKQKAKTEINENFVDKTKKSIPHDFLETLLSDSKNDTETEKQNKKILIDHFINGKSWAEIGRNLSLTRERVRQKGIEAIKKIRERYRLILDDFDFFYNPE